MKSGNSTARQDYNRYLHETQRDLDVCPTGIFGINVLDDLSDAVLEEEPGGMRGVVADELEVGLPETTG